MILRGARVAIGPEETANLDVTVSGGRIQAMRNAAKPPKGVTSLDLGGHLILPGLINAHDHLEFNLYPRLGAGGYPSAEFWARDIYRPDESPVKEQQRIPKSARLLWGGLKNLLSGVTTVCHHNPRELAVFDRNFPVRVVKRFGWAHSLAFSDDVAERFRATPPDWPFVLHLGEGVDRRTRQEIFRLDELGALDQRTILVHAVALDRKGRRLAKERRAALVWCPSSNLFLLGRTLSLETLRSGIPIALGSDSALTARGDFLDEMKVALEVSGLPNPMIYRMVTEGAARILRLWKGAGGLASGFPADLIVLRDNGRLPAAALARARAPSVVMVNGKLKLVSTELGRRLPSSRLHHLNVEGRGEFLVDANIPKLRSQAERAIGTEIRLAGRRVHP
jgi:cytosine/adenosine deaminase-related metal-dependent hydrolase